ncbi:MAG: NAD(P)-binding domain-containing protein, partial [Planctomycetota bacterium]|nr:NAD(P)-binding domain-containing protein [Planctomycetota bacterium]
FFDRLDDKRVLLIGAGEMGQETLRYLTEAGARHVTVMNRNIERAEQLASQLGAVVADWDSLVDQLSEADLVVSTTGAAQPIVTSDMYRSVSRRRHQRPLFVLDLAVPRDFAADLGEFSSVYLYSLDDLQAVCEMNRKSRQAEWPQAERIIESETVRFMTELQHRDSAPTIRRFREQAELAKDRELRRLWNRLEKVSEADQREITRSFDRLVNKLLHPPLESLRDEARQGNTAGLLDALKRLFQLHD